VKLNFYGITGKANEWIKSYLQNRYQRVEIKNKNSSPNAFSNWGIHLVGGLTQNLDCYSLS
jgi:hypothetical protein